MRAEDIFKNLHKDKKNDWQEVLDELEKDNRFFIDNDICSSNNDNYKFQEDIIFIKNDILELNNELKTIQIQILNINKNLDLLIKIIKDKLSDI